MIALPRKAPGRSDLVDRYSSLLHTRDADEYRRLVPIEGLPAVRAEVERSLRPASQTEIAKAAAVLCGSFKIGNVLEDRRAFALAMIQEFLYPADILDDAIRLARRKFSWLPSIAEIVEICDDLMKKRRAQLHVVNQMAAEHQRRQQAAQQKQEEAEREAEWQARVRALIGDAASARGDFDLASRLLPLCSRDGNWTTWTSQLADDERWALTLFHRLALVARAKRAQDDDRIQLGHVVALAQMVAADEIGTESLVTAAEAGETAGLPNAAHATPADLDAALIEIQVACGCDRRVPLRIAPRDRPLETQPFSAEDRKRVAGELARFQLPSEDSPGVQAWLRKMAEAEG